MLNISKFQKNERGQTALEAAIILIAFIVVASVFAFAILSAGNSSTDRGEAAIYSGIQGVSSSMSLKGAVMGAGTAGTSGAAGTLDNVTFTVTLGAGGNPIDLTPPSGATAKNVVTVNYRDQKQAKSDMTWTIKFVGKNNGDNMLDAGETAEITVDLTGLTTKAGPSTEFTIEVKSPAGAVLNFKRTTPPAIEAVMELR